MTVLGIGTDILRIAGLSETSLKENDAFLAATYTAGEIAQAKERPQPFLYYAGRFCLKEAVFKALGLCGEDVRLCEIEILADALGRPFVRLYGELARAAAKKGIEEILVSLSHDGGLAQAFALAQGTLPGKETT